MLQASSLATLPGIRHAFFTRSGGVSQGCTHPSMAGLAPGTLPKKVAENRARMATALGVNAIASSHSFKSIHRTSVVAQEPWTRDSRPRADAVVTQVPRLAIGVSTADCGPLLFADSEAGVIGAAHAGWRGALSGVIEATVAAMEQLGARRHGSLRHLGLQSANRTTKLAQSL